MSNTSKITYDGTVGGWRTFCQAHIDAAQAAIGATPQQTTFGECFGLQVQNQAEWDAMHRSSVERYTAEIAKWADRDAAELMSDDGDDEDPIIR